MYHPEILANRAFDSARMSKCLHILRNATTTPAPMSPQLNIKFTDAIDCISGAKMVIRVF
ncbi:hypothetical protein DXN04_09545 [Chitinophaga silvisoli]|uniref:Uncharacterized protein n=1 Tax=Chitinophaga silvisoli TaxID=2291814 RepID=A0A3E1P5Z0_9BACT|nr:hypothetical protein DXN04_09545 [Chitinophaga silvisoli]